MREHMRRPLSARLSRDEVHRLEVAMRQRSSSLAKPTGTGARCPACGGPLGAEEAIRIAGVLVHPGCLPSAAQP
jgi:hypothetical protein